MIQATHTILELLHLRFIIFIVQKQMLRFQTKWKLLSLALFTIPLETGWRDMIVLVCTLICPFVFAFVLFLAESSDLELTLLLDLDLLLDDEYERVLFLDLDDSGEFDFRLRETLDVFLLFTGDELFANEELFLCSLT